MSMLVVGTLNGVFYPAFAKKRDAGENLVEPYLHLVACNTALQWAAAVGLALAAVDIFVSGPERDVFTVIEVNSNPMIATLEEHQRWDLIIEIWRANFEAALR